MFLYLDLLSYPFLVTVLCEIYDPWLVFLFMDGSTYSPWASLGCLASKSSTMDARAWTFIIVWILVESERYEIAHESCQISLLTRWVFIHDSTLIFSWSFLSFESRNFSYFGLMFVLLKMSNAKLVVQTCGYLSASVQCKFPRLRTTLS